MFKRILTAACAVILLLTGCGSDYSDAQLDVPANWADYTIENLSSVLRPDGRAVTGIAF